MTTESDDFRQSLVAAVEAELKRHASAVVAEVDRLRDEGRRDRAELRAELTQQLSSLALSVDQVKSRSDEAAEKVRGVIQQRLTESEARQTRRIDDVSSGIDGMVQAAAKPVLSQVGDDLAAMNHRIEGLDGNLRRFDEQAARMVTYFNDVSQQMETRQDELGETLKGDLTAQITSIRQLVDDNDSSIRRFQNEVGQSVTQKLNDAEDRFNNRLLASESRMKEDVGQKIADIDVHVSRVSSGLDETMVVLNDRISGLDNRFAETGRRLDAVEEAVQDIDRNEIDELKDKLSTAAGEAMLVRIEMERFEKTVGEKTDGLVVRMTDVETQLQDATMDVSTAVQLDRLEELERAMMELDPTQYVLKDESPLHTGRGSTTSDESLKIDAGGADAPHEIDFSAIVSADENRSHG